MNIVQEVIDAEKRIRPHILKTPLLYSHFLSSETDANVFLKLESEQHTGSFKARGSLNKLMSLSSEEKARGAITASTGNHAQGFARACEITNTHGTIYLPENASPAKIAALEQYDVELRTFGASSLDTEIHAREQAETQGFVWVSPYNDSLIMGGQGTIGIELEEQIDHIDDLLVTVGGGGLISGVGSYIKSYNPECRIIGCQPEASPEMTLSIEAGQITNLESNPPTLSDGSAGGIEADAITFPICQQIIDKSILVTEEEIAEAIAQVAKHHKKIIEGAAGVAVASLLKGSTRFNGRTVVVIICGGNIDLKVFKSLI